MSQTLFSKDLEQRRWVKFSAKGFSQPVSGMIFRHGEVLPGMPLGGIGTGFIVLGTDSTLDYMSTIFNDFLGRAKVARAALGLTRGGIQFRERKELPSVRFPFLAISLQGHTTLLSLHEIEGVDKVKDIHYWGHYPVVDLEYEADLPISVGMRAWAPFLPGDSVTSNTPGAVFEVHLRNTSKKPQTGCVAFSFAGPRDAELSHNGGPEIGVQTHCSHEKVNGEFSGVIVTANSVNVSYALGVIGEHHVRVGGRLGEKAADWNNISTALPEVRTIQTSLPPDQQPKEGGASVTVDFSLEPGNSEVIPFVLAWYTPYWQGDHFGMVGRLAPAQTSARINWSAVQMNNYVHMYAQRFKDIREVAKYLAKEHERLLGRVLAWQEVIYAEEELPGWLQDSLINVLGILAQQTFWGKIADPNHWCKEGFFSVNESLVSCPHQSCIVCDMMAHVPVDLFFPDLVRTKMRIFKHYQRECGMTQGGLGLGTELDMRWYEQQTTGDGQAYVLLVERLWQSSGDDAILEEFYPSVKACMRFMHSYDTDDDGLLEVNELDSPNYGWSKGQYHDMWRMSGSPIHMAGMWLATLKITERMAEKMNDHKFAEKCRATYRSASKSMEEKLWNEKAGSYLLYHDPQKACKSDTVLSDQLLGDYVCALEGLPPVFPADRAKTVLKTLWRLNVSAGSPFGIRTAVKPDGSMDMAGGYTGTGIVPSYCTLVPAIVMIRSGDLQRGLEIVHRVWHRMVADLGMAWDQPAGLTAEGKFGFGHEYFHNTMLWALPLAVLGEDVRRSCGQGFVQRIIQAARQKDVRCCGALC